MLPFLLNALYLLALLALAPWLLWKALATGKYRYGIWQRLTGSVPGFEGTAARAAVWFHGVSVGEIHLLRTIVAEFRARHPHLQLVISTTTESGLIEAKKCYPDLTIIRWPFDFSWAVGRALHAIRPRMVVLAESELWPNFLLAAQRRRIPVVVVNARISPRSFHRLMRVRSLLRHWLIGIQHFAVQTNAYARLYRALGVPGDRITVTGSSKYDSAETNRDNQRTQELARVLRVTATDLVWVAGSTLAPEEETVLRVFRKLRADFPQLRLFVVPRQRERFDEVADLLVVAGASFMRRSTLTSTDSTPPPLVLVDSIGELGAVWGLADIAFVGGSLDGQRGGQNMIEPAAYGAAVLFGPHTWNFRDTVSRMLDAHAALQIADEQELESAMRRLLVDENGRRRLGAAARALVHSQQGATERILQVLDRFLM